MVDDDGTVTESEGPSVTVTKIGTGGYCLSGAFASASEAYLVSVIGIFSGFATVNATNVNNPCSVGQVRVTTLSTSGTVADRYFTVTAL